MYVLNAYFIFILFILIAYYFILEEDNAGMSQCVTCSQVMQRTGGKMNLLYICI